MAKRGRCYRCGSDDVELVTDLILHIGDGQFLATSVRPGCDGACEKCCSEHVAPELFALWQLEQAINGLNDKRPTDPRWN